jgi:hypothetical protein
MSKREWATFRMKQKWREDTTSTPDESESAALDICDM